MTEAYPLQWPEGWPRTRHERRRSPGAQFGYHLTLEKARRRLFEELRLLGATKPVLSTNVPLRKDGMPRSDFARYRYDDAGCAIYFTKKDRQLCMAHDAWDRVEANVNSLALAISGLRQMQRHGGAHMIERAFTGFLAIEAPSWRRDLGIGPAAGLEDAERAYHMLAREAHPDRPSGSDAAMARLNVAIDAARRELETA